MEREYKNAKKPYKSRNKYYKHSNLDIYTHASYMIKEKNSKITSVNAENHFIKNHVGFKEKNSYKTRNKKKLSKCGKAQFKNLPQQMLLVLQQVHPFRSLEQPKEACYLSCVLKAIITSIYHCPGTPGCQNYKRKISKYKDFFKFFKIIICR